MERCSPSVGRRVSITTVSLTSKMVFVRMVNGQILNNTGYTFYNEMLNTQRKHDEMVFT